MSNQGAREGKELVGQTVDTIATMANPDGGETSFLRLTVSGHKCVPDSRTLGRATWASSKPYPDVFVTQVVDQVPGIVFCRFRPIGPADISPRARLAPTIPFTEAIRFMRFDGDNLVIEYQCALDEYVWDSHGARSIPVEFSIHGSMRGIELRHRRDFDRERGFCWQLSCNREFVDELGGKGLSNPHFNELFWVESEEVCRGIHERFPDAQTYPPTE